MPGQASIMMMFFIHGNNIFVLIYVPLSDPLMIFFLFILFGRVQALRGLKNAENSGSH